MLTLEADDILQTFEAMVIRLLSGNHLFAEEC